MTNVLFGLLLIFCGVNVSLDTLPGWMAVIGRLLPLTHAIEAARELVTGASLGAVGGLVGTELLIGAVYGALGMVALAVLEVEGRRRATLELQ
ncbi:MAG: ABC transporter permease, partial [Mycobacteriales bacterium]